MSQPQQSADESQIVLKRRSHGSPNPAASPADGEPHRFPWTSAAATFIRFIAFGWIIQSVFAVAIGFDAASNATSLTQMIEIIFHGIDSIFISLTLAFCLLSVSELAPMLARYISRPRASD